jgi:hypothetical protein
MDMGRIELFYFARSLLLSFNKLFGNFAFCFL